MTTNRSGRQDASSTSQGQGTLRFPPGIAYADGAFCNIADAKLSVLDWGFLRSDATYDVVHVWNGRFFVRTATSIASC
jgi:branched-chain amino acid aminotransferase